MLSKNVSRSMYAVQRASRSAPRCAPTLHHKPGSSATLNMNRTMNSSITNTNCQDQGQKVVTKLNNTQQLKSKARSSANEKILMKYYNKNVLTKSASSSLPSFNLIGVNDEKGSMLNTMNVNGKNNSSLSLRDIMDNNRNHNNIMNLIKSSLVSSSSSSPSNESNYHHNYHSNLTGARKNDNLLISASQEFYTTMQNVLMHTTGTAMNTQTEINNRIMSSIFVDTTNSAIANHQWRKNNNNHHYHHHNFHKNDNMMMVNCRQFSTAGPSPPSKSDESSTKSTSPATEMSNTSTTTSTTTSTSNIKQKPPATLKKDATIQEKTMAALNSALSSLSSFLAKIPGVLWFYITHPKEFKEKMIELKEAAKKEAHHYYMGSKLLMADVKVARQLLGRLLQGSTLTRRERKQFIRTVTDVFRIVPMSIFVLIPFMEFALPFALKMFPNMLPSTFQDSLKAEENMKRELKSRIAMAEFFQESLHDLAKGQRKNAASKKAKIKAAEDNDNSSSSTTSTTESELESREETAASFLEFIEKARKGEFLPPEVIIRYSAFFKDQLTLDSMPRMQLINMCKYMSIPPYGNDHFLRFQLRHRVRILQEDDQRILWEGIDSLTKMELREACQERGMRSTGLSKEAYKRSLQQWIDLSVNRNVPISLLIMSRTFFLREEMTSRASLDTDGSKSVAGLADAISGLDKEVVNEVILESVTAEDEKGDATLMKLKLEVLEHQNEMIQEEKEQRLAEEAKKAEQALEKQVEKQGVQEDDKAVKQNIVDKTLVKKDDILSQEENISLAREIEEPKTVTTEEPQADTISVSEMETVKEIVDKEEEREKLLSSEEIDAISQLVSPDPVSAEREKLEKIKAAIQEEKDEEDPTPVAQSQEEEKELGAENGPPLTIDEVGKDIEAETFADDQDKTAAEQIISMEEKSRIEADSSTTISMEGKIKEDLTETPSSSEEEDEKTEYKDEKLEKAIARLKSKVQSMVGNIEVQLSDIEEKIGDKMHFLDKDMDGILSREEMALCLQSVLKRPLTTDEAMAIAADMDENEDGYFSMDELSKWLETNKLVKLVEEGRDAEVDEIISKQADKMKDEQQEVSVSKGKDK